MRHQKKLERHFIFVLKITNEDCKDTHTQFNAFIFFWYQRPVMLAKEVKTKKLEN